MGTGHSSLILPRCLLAQFDIGGLCSFVFAVWAGIIDPRILTENVNVPLFP